MLLSENLLLSLLETHKICDSFGSLLFSWDQGFYRMVVKSTSQTRIHALRVFSSVCYLVGIVIQVGLAFLNPLSVIVISHTAMFLPDFTLNVVTMIVNFVHRHKIVALINAMITYERQSNRKC